MTSNVDKNILQTEIHYIRTVNMNDTGELYKYEVKEVEKLDETSFKISAEGELFVTIDNEWHVSSLIFLSRFCEIFIFFT